MTYDFLENEHAFAEFLYGFEQGTLPRPVWTHAAHLAIGAWYLLSFPEEMAIDRVRTGIRHYNQCAGIANTPDSGYHETLTLFWLGILGGQVSNLRSTSRRLALDDKLDAIRRLVAEFAPQRDLFKQYYSFDVVASQEARARWIPPDRIVWGGGNKSTLIDI
jgi:hypothetical protein